MKTIIIFLMFLFSGLAISAQNISTGYESLDESLSSLNEQVKDNPVKFVEINIITRFNLPKDKVLNLNKNDKLSAAEIFLITYISVNFKKDLDQVIVSFRKNKSSIKSFLDEMGIVGKSKEFKNVLKASINIHPKPFLPTKK